MQAFHSFILFCSPYIQSFWAALAHKAWINSSLLELNRCCTHMHNTSSGTAQQKKSAHTAHSHQHPAPSQLGVHTRAVWVTHHHKVLQLAVQCCSSQEPQPVPLCIGCERPQHTALLCISSAL